MYFSDSLLLSFPNKQNFLSLELPMLLFSAGRNSSKWAQFPWINTSSYSGKCSCEQERSCRIIRPASKFDKFNVPLFRITILLLQMSETSLADELTKASHAFPRESRRLFYIFSTISVNTRVLVLLSSSSKWLLFFAVTFTAQSLSVDKKHVNICFQDSPWVPWSCPFDWGRA